MKEYKVLLQAFDCERLMCAEVQDVTEEKFASFLFGLLVRRAISLSGTAGELSLKSPHGFPYFVVEQPTKGRSVKNIPKSLAGRHFMDVAFKFTDRERAAMVLLLGWVGGCDELAFLAGFTCHLAI